MTTMPNMWLVHNEELNLFIHRKFLHIERYKADGIQEYQPRVTKVENGFVYRETVVHITSIDDKGDYYYIGHRPVAKDAGAYTFGYTRLYKNETPKYGTIAFVELG